MIIILLLIYQSKFYKTIKENFKPVSQQQGFFYLIFGLAKLQSCFLIAVKPVPLHFPGTSSSPS